MMAKLTSLEYWHSFRPPNRSAVYVDPCEVSSIRQRPHDERISETVTEVSMKNGQMFVVEGRSDDVATALLGDYR